MLTQCISHIAPYRRTHTAPSTITLRIILYIHVRIIRFLFYFSTTRRLKGCERDASSCLLPYICTHNVYVCRQKDVLMMMIFFLLRKYFSFLKIKFSSHGLKMNIFSV